MDKMYKSYKSDGMDERGLFDIQVVVVDDGALAVLTGGFAGFRGSVGRAADSDEIAVGVEDLDEVVLFEVADDIGNADR